MLGVVVRSSEALANGEAGVIRRVLAAVLAIGVGCLPFIYPEPNSWSLYVGGFLIFGGLAMLAIAFLARSRPGL